MDELMRRLAANGFAEIEGLQVTGTLPVRQDIVNDVITGLLRDVQSSSPAPAAKAPEPAGGEVNWWKLVSKLQVLLKDGKLIIDFELRR